VKRLLLYKTETTGSAGRKTECTGRSRTALTDENVIPRLHDRANIKLTRTANI